MKSATIAFIAAMICVGCVSPLTSHAGDETRDSIKRVVDSAVRPLMAKDNIPGMAVAVTVSGQTYVFNYGMASMKAHQSVTNNTLFVIGSVSKTFTATLASWAQATHRLSLSNATATYLPSMQGTQFGRVTLLNLGTHTPGGFPLQVPDDITNNEQLMQYLKRWRATYAPDTYRTYSNPGIGMLGLITAKRMGQNFTTLIERQLFPALGLTHSFINVPANEMDNYAEGYTNDGAPIRMATGVLWSETYGVKSTASDTIRFVEANMSLIKLNDSLQSAITQTHTGYFKAGPMTQDLIWEQYPYPVTLTRLLDGNSPSMIFQPTPASAIRPPETAPDDVWINKTGSTNGFGAYVAFVPERRLGIVVLANKSFPIADRVSAAYNIARSLVK